MHSEPTVKALSTRQVLLRIIIIICSLEFLIMLVLHYLPEATTSYRETVIDTALLALLSTPSIYLWVVKPFVKAHDEMFARINHLAHIDPLTQLANRRLLNKHLEKAVAGIARNKIYGALLLLDLDRFKPVNDKYGHDAGDAVLIEIARRLQSITRAEDVVARPGGDEFLIYISRLDSDESRARDKASKIAAGLIKLVNDPIHYHDESLRVTASIGIRLLGNEKIDTETAIHEADTAMYRAKNAGRNRAVIYENTNESPGTGEPDTSIRL